MTDPDRELAWAQTHPPGGESAEAPPVTPLEKLKAIAAQAVEDALKEGYTAGWHDAQLGKNPPTRADWTDVPEPPTGER
jgi:hypothetical protein